jgi:alkaline phosphatase
MKKIALLLLFFANLSVAQSGEHYRVHSHNDYLQNVPFWKAFAAGASSIEADVFLVGDYLYVAHTQEEIDTERSLETLYLEPLQKALSLGLEHPKNLQLLIDVKSEPYVTLDELIKTLKDYPLIIENDAVTITISGNRPKPSEYPNYPDFISFDHQSLEPIENPAILEKIALISLSFRNFSEWNGKGRLTAEDLSVSGLPRIPRPLGRPLPIWGWILSIRICLLSVLII